MGQTEKVAAAKKCQIQADLVGAAAYDGSFHDQYLKATSKNITERIQRGEWTASRVLEAYIARAAYAHHQTNCLTEIMFDRARKMAEELDDKFVNTGKLRTSTWRPDQFQRLDFVGVDSSLGFSQWVGNKPTADAEIAKQLIAAGGIPFVKTNIPQTLFAFECCNPVFGRTSSPYNTLYTCGGSSGGEGALLGMDGSVIGVGTDIGGSLRIPAFYNGIYSLKPGSGRVSIRGCRDPTPGFEGIVTTAGPMARSVDDLEVAAKLMFGNGCGNVVPVPFREVELPAKLKLGYYTSDGCIKASPACKRAVLETIEVLRKQDHECVEVVLPAGLAAEAFNIFVGLTSADGYKTLTSHLGPDPKEEALFLPTLATKVPRLLRVLAHWIIRNIVGDKFFADSVAAARPKSLYEYTQLVERREAVKEYFKTEVWEKYELDGIIAPVQALPQLPHGGCKLLSCLAISTNIHNVLDIPTGTIPVTHVDPSLDILTEEWKSGPGLGSKMLEKELYHKKNPVYDAEKMKGMPVGVQIAALRWEDEKVLGMMRIVDDALGPRKFGPGAFIVAHPVEE